jgi:hypothetical protein
MLFIEGLLLGDAAGLVDVGRFLPGAAAAAISGQEPGTLLAPGLGALLLVLYAVATAAIGWVTTTRRDVV